jgi:hypothetical protein
MYSECTMSEDAQTQPPNELISFTRSEVEGLKRSLAKSRATVSECRELPKQHEKRKEVAKMPIRGKARKAPST